MHHFYLKCIQDNTSQSGSNVHLAHLLLRLLNIVLLTVQETD